MVMAVFTPEAEFTLLYMYTKESTKRLVKRMPVEELPPYDRKSRSPEQMEVIGYIFEKFLRGRFCAYAVKIWPIIV